MNPQCGCNPGPVTIYAKSTRPDLNNNIFPDGVVLTYQAQLPEYVTLSLGEFYYVSDDTYIEPGGGGNEFRVLLICSGVAYRWVRAFASYNGGGPSADERYSWLPGNSGNPCEPFYQLNGTMFSGGNTAGKVYLSAIDGDWKIGTKSVRVRAYRPFPTPVAGATVSIDGQTGITNAAGEVYLWITQSSSNIPWSVSKAGLTTQTGNVPGATPVPAEVQFYQFSATFP